MRHSTENIHLSVHEPNDGRSSSPVLENWRAGIGNCIAVPISNKSSNSTRHTQLFTHLPSPGRQAWGQFPPGAVARRRRRRRRKASGAGSICAKCGRFSVPLKTIGSKFFLPWLSASSSSPPPFPRESLQAFSVRLGLDAMRSWLGWDAGWLSFCQQETSGMAADGFD